MIRLTLYNGKGYLDDTGIQWVMAGDTMEEIAALKARIAELELILAADKLIEDGWIGRIEAGDKRIAELEAENAKLRASAVMWHKYPDEEPEPSHEYEVNIPLIVVIKTSHCWTDFALYNLDSFRFWRHGNKEEGVTHWAYLPDTPTRELVESLLKAQKEEK